MKRRLLLLLVAIVVGVCLSHAQQMTSFEDGDYAYLLRSDNYVYCSGFSTQGANKSIEDVTIPTIATYNGVKYYVKAVYGSAFRGNSTIKSVGLAVGLEAIGNKAFAGCSNLSVVKLSGSVRSIESTAFDNSPQLSTLKVKSYNPPSYSPSSETKNNVKVVLPWYKGIIPRYKATNWSYFNIFETDKSNFDIVRISEGYGGSVYSSCPQGIATEEVDVEMIVTDVDPTKEEKLEFFAFSYPEKCMRYIFPVLADSAFVGRNLTGGIDFHFVRTIGKAAFYGCTDLRLEAIMCDTIGVSAFENCSNLNFTLDKGVKFVATRAFAGTAITGLNITKTVKVFALDACDRCPNFVEFRIDPDNPYFSVSNGLLYNKEQTELLRVPVAMDPNKWFEKDVPPTLTKLGMASCSQSIFSTPYREVMIPPGVKTIGNFAFQNSSNIYSVVIPSSVTTIGNYAFWATDLHDVRTGASAPMRMGNNPFYGCQLSELRVPVGSRQSFLTAEYWKDFPTIKSGGYDFYNNATITNNLDFIVTKSATSTEHGEVAAVYGTRSSVFNSEIPESVIGRNNLTYDVVSLGDSVFAGNKYLENVEIPNNIFSISRWAFKNCTKLKTATIGDGTIDVGADAFNGCTSLKTLTIGEGLKDIGADAFAGCTRLDTVYWNAVSVNDFNSSTAPFLSLDISKIYIGKKITRVPSFLCYGAGLKEVYLPARNNNPLTSIGDYAFAHCNLKSLDLPLYLTSIGEYAFVNNTSLKEVTIPYTVKTLGNGAFRNCGLTTVNWNAKSVPDYSSSGLAPFAYCSNITNINFYKYVTRIPAFLCADKTKLASVIIPASVTEIGNCAFADCTALANIYPQTKEPETLTYGTNIFLGVDKETCRIIVPTGTLSKYKSTLPWKEFFHIEQGSGFAPGDVNGDGVVNGSDVTSLYNVLLDNTPVGGDADVNSDGVVSGADVTALYNILLSGN